MGLRFSCVAGWGWVVGMGSCIARCAHPLEKSAADFRIQAYIAYFLRSDVLRTSLLQNSQKFACRNRINPMLKEKSVLGVHQC
jgi:hypothetical protein